MAHEPLITSFKDADPTQVDMWGTKGAGLAEDFQCVEEDFLGMEHAVAVPDGFILSTRAWQSYHAAKRRLGDNLFHEIKQALSRLEEREGRRFGATNGKMPLIVAVRGGSPVSLPGALATILNVGLNDEVVSALIEGGEDEGFVLATYLSAIRMYGEAALGVPYRSFYNILQHYRVGGEGSIPVIILPQLIEEFKELLQKAEHPLFPAGFPADLENQLRHCIEAVLHSWMSPMAIEARSNRIRKIPDAMGTAVIIQTMVFGNRDERNCLSGVFFTRNQRTGSNVPIIEWAPKVQCDKIVSGRLRRPLFDTHQLEKRFPDIYRHLMLLKERGESRTRHPLDIEFTVENGKLFVLQRRILRMTFNATVRAMWDLVDEGKTSVAMASVAINNALEQPEKILRDDFYDYQVLARGEPITNSADSGILVLGSEEAMDLARQGVDVILLRKRPYGEDDLAINNPRIRAVIRCDGNRTGHEAVSAVAYSKPYLINVVDSVGKPLIVDCGEDVVPNPESSIFSYIGKEVFVDGERGILGHTQTQDYLEDRKVRKKLYVDWEYLREQFDAQGYGQWEYDALLDVHCRWEIELERYQKMEKALREGSSTFSEDELLLAFGTYVSYIPGRDLDRTLGLKEVRVEDFDLGPPIVYRGGRLEREVLKVLRALMLCTTWRTHWVHGLMVKLARERGDTENDVLRDIFLKNRTMSIVESFEREGFHVFKGTRSYYLILASNFEYDRDVDDSGSQTINFGKKEGLARQFLVYLHEMDPEAASGVHMIKEEPPLGQGHARIISMGLAIPEGDFDLVCRYLRAFLDRASSAVSPNSIHAMIPQDGFIPLYQLDPFFASYPDLRISRQSHQTDEAGEYLLAFGLCSFGEMDRVVYGKEEYDQLMEDTQSFERYLALRGLGVSIRPWQFEVDPYRRHSIIAVVGIRFGSDHIQGILNALRGFLVPHGQGISPGFVSGRRR